MFKRVEKRLRKKQKEEELGLDGEMKDMLGMNDTDSDESQSSSSGSESGPENGDLDMDDGEVNDAGEEVEKRIANEEEEEESADEDEETEEPSMSVSEALKNSLYIVSLQPETKACIVCPGKLLKNPIMTDVHLKSGAHTRRFARLRETAMDVDADTDVRDLLRSRLVSQPSEKPAEVKGKLSKRAEKKKAKLCAIKVKRAKQQIMKAKYRAKQEAKLKAEATSGTESEDASENAGQLPAKKRKMVRTPEAEVESSQAVAEVRKPKDAKPPRQSKKSEAFSKDKQRVTTGEMPKPSPASPSEAMDSQKRTKTKRRRSESTS